VNAPLALALAVACFVAGASMSKVYVASGRLWILVAGLALYTAGNIIMVRLMRETGLGPAISLSTVAQLIAINIVAFTVFGERPSPVQMLGIGTGLVAVALILLPTLNR
jgi:multidrug transporter EmrE-like cation transporter